MVIYDKIRILKEKFKKLDVDSMIDVNKADINDYKEIMEKNENFNNMIVDFTNCFIENGIFKQSKFEMYEATLSSALINFVNVYILEKRIPMDDNEMLVSTEDTFSENDLGEYLKEIGKYKLLKPEEEKELAERIAMGDEQAKKDFINSNLRLVVSVAKRFYKNGIELLDLIQDGNIGLMIAVDKFDATMGYKFSTYATWWIKQTIMRGIQNTSRTIRVPAYVYCIGVKVETYKKSFLKNNGYEPDLETIASDLDISIEDVRKVEKAFADNESFDRSIGDKEDTTVGELIADSNQNVEAEAIRNLLPDYINDMLSNLSEKERNILQLRYKYEKTLEEIGKMYGITRERVRKIEQNTLSKIRRSSNGKNLKDYLK